MESAVFEFVFETEDSSTKPGASRLSFNLFLDEGDDGVGDVRDVGPTIRRDRSWVWAREACRRRSARVRRPEAKPLFVLFKGSGSSIGWRKLTDLAPLTVTTAPSAKITFLSSPASTSC